MITEIKYIASSGNEYNLTANGVLHKEANYFDWAWDVEGTQLKYGMRVADFSRKAAEYDAELVFYGTLESRRATIKALHNDFENDVRNRKPGRIVWGDYYLDCYITESAVVPFEKWSYINDKIHIYAPYPFWMRDVKISLPVSAVVTGSYLDYTFDYTYDYSSPTVGTRLIQSDFPFASEFRMVIYGLAVNPRVVINGYAYVLYTTVPSGAYVIIDSKQKSIMMYDTDGTASNLFDYRNKTDSIFEKIPGGNLEIVWDATFGVDITIYQEKSEPEFEEVE